MSELLKQKLLSSRESRTLFRQEHARMRFTNNASQNNSPMDVVLTHSNEFYLKELEATID